MSSSSDFWVLDANVDVDVNIDVDVVEESSSPSFRCVFVLMVVVTATCCTSRYPARALFSNEGKKKARSSKR